MQTVNIAPVQEFLQAEMDPDALAENLEEIIFDYSQYLLRDTDLCGAIHEAGSIYWVREFIKTLRQAMASKS